MGLAETSVVLVTLFCAVAVLFARLLEFETVVMLMFPWTCTPLSWIVAVHVRLDLLVIRR